MSTFAGLIARPLDTAGPAQGGFDVIVVLGANLAADGTLSAALRERVHAGVAAFADGLAPRMVMTGAHEARAMRREAVRCGVPERAIFVEERALTTRENATHTAALLHREGWLRALLVTQPFHRRRGRAAFRRAGIDCHALPFVAHEQTLKGVVREYFALGYYQRRRWI